MNRITKRFNKKTILLIVLVGLIAAGLWWRFHPNNESTADIARKKGDVTGQLDRQNAQKNKKTAASNDSGNAGPDQNLQPVTPVLSRWDSSSDPIQIAGFVQGVLEEGGTCTYVFTQDSQSFSKTSQGFQDATHTSCAPVDVSKSSFPRTGSWSVVLKYKSSTSSGASNAQSFTIK